MDDNQNKKPNVLLVDDDEDIRSTYADAFRQQGFEVREAKDGVEALDLVSQKKPDAIFSGIIMPRMDGFDMMENLKKSVETSNIPVIISSHLGREEDKKKAKELGAKDFIVYEMVTPNEAIERVRAAFNHKTYYLAFKRGRLDAQEISKDFHLNEKMICEKCGREMVLELQLVDVEAKEFRARFVCKECQNRS